MKTPGFDKPTYILPFDLRGSFVTKMFGWHGDLGRKAAIDEGVPVPVLTTALYERFSSRSHADFQEKVLSATRHEFGGHLEKSAV